MAAAGIAKLFQRQLKEEVSAIFTPTHTSTVCVSVL